MHKVKKMWVWFLRWYDLSRPHFSPEVLLHWFFSSSLLEAESVTPKKVKLTPSSKFTFLASQWITMSTDLFVYICFNNKTKESELESLRDNKCSNIQMLMKRHFLYHGIRTKRNQGPSRLQSQHLVLPDEAQKEKMAMLLKQKLNKWNLSQLNCTIYVCNGGRFLWNDTELI